MAADPGKKINVIFFVDDKVDDTLLFETAVYGIDRKINFISFTDASHALESVIGALIKPDVIILDINTPAVTGFEWLRLFKANSAVASIPVVIFTAAKDEKIREECLRLGAHSFYNKPDSFKDLGQVVKQILGDGSLLRKP